MKSQAVNSGTKKRNMSAYSIKDLERLSGIKAHTIRIWEKRYKLIEPKRTSSNIRTYCDSELKKLLNISILYRNGLKISKISTLTEKELTEKINQIVVHDSDTQSKIEGLTIAMTEYDEIKFERILSRAIMQYGFEDTIIKIIYPFIVKVGLLWQTNCINPAREHFITNLIRQKLFVAIDSLINSEQNLSKQFLFFLPEREFHELGILFFAYMAKKRGHRIIYLGQSVPLSDVIDTVKCKSLDILVTAFVSSLNDDKEIIDYTEALSEKTGNLPLYISGAQALNINKKLPANVKIISSPAQFADELAKLNNSAVSDKE
jgi:DNA-binding transcriptional MerR regulator